MYVCDVCVCTYMWMRGGSCSRIFYVPVSMSLLFFSRTLPQIFMLCRFCREVKWFELNTQRERKRESVLVSSVAKWGWCKVSMHANLFENHFIIEFLRFFKSHMFELQKNGINSLLNIGNLFILIRIFRNENVFCATPKLCKIFFQLHHCQWCSILITRKPTDLDDSLLNLILVCSTFQRSRFSRPEILQII